MEICSKIKGNWIAEDLSNFWKFNFQCKRDNFWFRRDFSIKTTPFESWDPCATFALFFTNFQLQKPLQKNSDFCAWGTSPPCTCSNCQICITCAFSSPAKLCCNVNDTLYTVQYNGMGWHLSERQDHLNGLSAKSTLHCHTVWRDTKTRTWRKFDNDRT